MEIQIVKFFQSASSAFGDAFFKFITNLGEGVFFMMVFLCFYWCVSQKTAFKLVYFYFISVGVNSVLKSIVARPRPYMADVSIQNKLPAQGLSFPSGHSQSFAALATFTSLQVEKNKSISKSLKIWFYCIISVLAIMLGISRMYLGQHYLTDVLAGLVLGVLVILATDAIFKVVPDKLKQKIGLPIVLIATNCLIVVLIIIFLCLNVLKPHYLTQLLEYGSLFMGASLGYYLSCKFVKQENISILMKIIKAAFGIMFFFGVGSLLYYFIPNTKLFLIVTNVMLSFLATFVYPYLFQYLEKKWLSMQNNNNIKKNSKQTKNK